MNPIDYQHGHSLVELMIAISLSLVLFSGLLMLHTMTLKNIKQYQSVEIKINRLSQALRLLENDIRSAGMTTCFSVNGFIDNFITNKTDHVSNLFSTNGLAGFYNANWHPERSNFEISHMDANHQAINIQYVDVGENISIKKAQSQPGRIFYLTNCQNAELATNSNSSLLKSSKSGTGLYIHPFKSVTYLLRKRSPGSSLYRQFLTKSGGYYSEPLIDDVEQIKFAYAERVSNSRLIFQPASLVTNWRNILAVHVHIVLAFNQSRHSISLVVPLLNHGN